MKKQLKTLTTGLLSGAIFIAFISFVFLVWELLGVLHYWIIQLTNFLK